MNSLKTTRDSLHRVAVHIVARSRVETEGRFSLRVSPGGFGTPEHGPNQRRVRVSGTNLVVESDAAGAASARSTPIEGTTLNMLAHFAGVDLTAPLDVGHDTPMMGDVDAPIELDHAVAAVLAGWYGDVAAMLDLVLVALPPSAAATLPRLWPEHFDVAVEAQARPDRRVNLGGSPGDGYSAEPYVYVGPWTADRPGTPDFWNAPFGATITRHDLANHVDSIVAAGAAFLLEGYHHLG